MGRYSRFEASFWKDPDARPLRPVAKLLYVWSFTNEACGIAGVYVVSPDTALHETSLRRVEFTVGWKQLLEYRKPTGWPLVMYDALAGLLWACGKLRREIDYNPSPLLVKGAAKEIRRLPKSPIWPVFANKYRGVFDGLLDFTTYTIDDKSANGEGIDTLSLPSHPIPSHTQPKPNTSPPGGFVRWWTEYPERNGQPRQGKAECLDYWQREKLETDADRIVAGIRAENVVRKKARDAGDFMAAPKDPIRWLKAKRWEDYEGQERPKVRVPERNRALTPEEIEQRRREKEARRGST